MSEVKTYTPQPITVTENAATKIANLLVDEGNLALKLRVYIEGGGCSGLQYGFTFDNDVTPEDFTVTKALEKTIGELQAIDLVVDSVSYQYLVGAEIDYEANINGEQFIIRNPNAATTCGCGSSFSVED